MSKQKTEKVQYKLDLESIKKHSFVEKAGKYLGTTDFHYKYLTDEAGIEHYKLLADISTQTRKGGVLIDLGTYKGLSALALAANPDVQVYTYDISRQNLYENIVEGEANITFKHQSCFDDVEFIAAADFIFLDIDPHDGDQERKLIDDVLAAGYKGWIFCDDILLNADMRTMWEELPYEKKDISTFGHSTGTGLIIL